MRRQNKKKHGSPVVRGGKMADKQVKNMNQNLLDKEAIVYDILLKNTDLMTNYYGKAY